MTCKRAVDKRTLNTCDRTLSAEAPCLIVKTYTNNRIGNHAHLVHRAVHGGLKSNAHNVRIPALHRAATYVLVRIAGTHLPTCKLNGRAWRQRQARPSDVSVLHALEYLLGVLYPMC